MPGGRWREIEKLELRIEPRLLNQFSVSGGEEDIGDVVSVPVQKNLATLVRFCSANLLPALHDDSDLWDTSSNRGRYCLTLEHCLDEIS